MFLWKYLLLGRGWGFSFVGRWSARTAVTFDEPVFLIHGLEWRCCLVHTVLQLINLLLDLDLDSDLRLSFLLFSLPRLQIPELSIESSLKKIPSSTICPSPAAIMYVHV